MSLLALLSKHNGRTVEKEPKLHHFSSPHSQISEKQACLRNSACVWLWCFTFYHSLFSESTVVEKLNRAQNSDSKTHAEKSNPTSRTDFRSKTLTDIFLGHPVYKTRYITNNKEADNDWFRLESNKEGTRWFGKCWHYHNQAMIKPAKTMKKWIFSSWNMNLMWSLTFLWLTRWQAQRSLCQSWMARLPRWEMSPPG